MDLSTSQLPPQSLLFCALNCAKVKRGVDYEKIDLAYAEIGAHNNLFGVMYGGWLFSCFLNLADFKH